MMLYHVKPLFCQPVHLEESGIVKIHSVGPHKGKSIEPDIALCCDLVIQLPHGTAAQISRILILGVHILNLLVDPLKILISDDRLSTEHQFSPETGY